MPPGPVALLRVLRAPGGPAAGGAIRLDPPGGEVTIGRDQPLEGVSFEQDLAMSRRHARVRILASGAVLIEDLGSGNGTVVNGQRIEIPRLLSVGDEIQVGGTTLRLERAKHASGGIGPPPGPSPEETRGTPVVPAARAPVPFDGPVSSPGIGVRHRPWVVVAVAGLAAVVAAFVVGRMVGHNGASSGGDPQLAVGTGTVYLESGVAQPGGNAIIAYRYRGGGDLRPLAVSEFPTGGAGGFDLTNTGALDADGQIVTSTDGMLLFAVNQGSDTVAAFHVRPDGSLVAVAGSPFASGGMAPGGLAISGSRLVVVNKAQDGVRDLSLVAPNVATFLVRSDGSLRPTGSVVALRAGTSPTEALVSPDGAVVIVPLEHGPFVSLTLDRDGKLSPVSGSPFSLPDAIFGANVPRSQRWALGLGALPAGGVFYGQVPDTGQLVVYQYRATGQLNFARALPDPGASLPCWSLLNQAGTRLYTDNAGNNTMSVFDLADPLNPHLLQVVTLKNAGNPWDLRMDPSGRFIFVLDARARQDLVPPGSGNELHTLLVTADGTLAEPDYSPVPIPVTLNTNPIGLAVVGR